MLKCTFIFLIDRLKRELHKAMLNAKYLPFLITLHNKHRRINRLDTKIKDTDNKSNSKEFKDEYISSSQ